MRFKNLYALSMIIATWGWLVLDTNGSKAATFYDNLSATYGGGESITSTDWMAAMFTTNASTYTSLTATLALTNTSAGTASLKLDSDGSLEPGSLLGTFTSPAAYSTALSQDTFTLSGVSLAANTNYWLVLSAPTGSFDWAWTSDFNYLQDWADSSTAGATWFGSDAYPPLFRVVSGIQPVGDYNANGTIDAGDYVVWRRQNGQTGSSLAADGDHNGVVDAIDYQLWRNSYGLSTTAAAAAGLGLNFGSLVPEPSAMVLVLIGSLCTLGRRRRCPRRI